LVQQPGSSWLNPPRATTPARAARFNQGGLDLLEEAPGMVLCPEIRSNPGDGLFPGQTVGCVVIEQRGNAQVVGGKGAVYLGILLTLKGALQGVGNVRLPIDSVKEAGQRFEELAVIVNQVGRKLNGDSHETVRQGLDLQAVKKGKRTAAHRESPSNLDVNSSLHNISSLTLY
jgi:hypothetical protein